MNKLLFRGSGLYKWMALFVSLTGSTFVDAQTHSVLDMESEIRPFAAKANLRFGLESSKVEAILAKAHVDENVLKSIQRPAEALLWRQYRKIFMTQKRIDHGIIFWEQNASILEAAENKYTVPKEIILAILGVETFYGRYTGKTRVLDALATLGFRYPKRGKFFRSELMQYLKLVTDEGLDPLWQMGSYAGAMGIPQFIASSYHNYAVDFDNDQVRDLMHSNADAIGSVANYLKRHGWIKDGGIAVSMAWGGQSSLTELLSKGLKPHTQISELRRMGFRLREQYAGNARAAVIALQGEQGPEYWLGLNNFYVITRYNHSPLYAMAVAQLAAALHAKMAEAN